MEYSDHILTPEYVRRNQEVFYQKDGGFYHAFRDKDGEVIATSYCLFPGVVLTFKEVHRHHYISNWRVRSDQGLRIEFCKEGCLECQVGTKSLNHMAGDVTLFHLDRRVCHQRYPLKDFYSISIAVDLEQFSSAPAGYFGKLDLEVESLQEKYQLKEQLFRVLRSPRELEHVFLEMLGAPETVKINYWKVKVSELFLLLLSMDLEKKEPEQKRISRAQAVIAKEAHRYLMDNLQEHITIAELAKRLSTSPTQLKEGFRAVYGAPIQTFIREERIHAAGELLSQTNMKIRDIAEQFGYINVSKFSAAFFAVKGMRPMEYREKYHTDPRHEL